MKEFHVPGISLAVVKDGKVVVAKGYGIRELGKPRPVDSKTLFGIASNTKAFTATALALLVEEGTFSLTPEGTIEQAKMRAASPSVDFSFDFQDLLLKPVQETQK